MKHLNFTGNGQFYTEQDCNTSDYLNATRTNKSIEQEQGNLRS